MHVVQVISALSCCKPVVTADWLEVLVKCCKQQKQLPDPARSVVLAQSGVIYQYMGYITVLWGDLPVHGVHYCAVG